MLSCEQNVRNEACQSESNIFVCLFLLIVKHFVIKFSSYLLASNIKKPCLLSPANTTETQYITDKVVVIGNQYSGFLPLLPLKRMVYSLKACNKISSKIDPISLNVSHYGIASNMCHFFQSAFPIVQQLLWN